MLESDVESAGGLLVPGRRACVRAAATGIVESTIQSGCDPATDAALVLPPGADEGEFAVVGGTAGDARVIGDLLRAMLREQCPRMRTGALAECIGATLAGAHLPFPVAVAAQRLWLALAVRDGALPGHPFRFRPGPSFVVVIPPTAQS